MQKLIRTYQKQLLAVFGVLLMIVFVIPSTAKQSGFGSEKHVVAHVGSTPVYADDQQRAEQGWAILTEMTTRLSPFQFVGEEEYQREMQQMGDMQRPDMTTPALYPFVLRLGSNIVRDMQRHRDLYFLLTLEAQRQGIEVSDAEVNDVIVNEMFTQDGKRISLDTLPRDRYTPLFAATREFLKVQTLRDRAAANIKFTSPMWQHYLSENFQRFRLTYTELTAGEFVKKVAAPTTQQLQAQFDANSHTAPSNFSKPDSLGFAYGVSDRVKLQYLTIPHKAVVAAALAQRKPYDWEVENRKYYYEHIADFVRVPPPSTQPSAAPTTSPSGSGLTLGPDTHPATLPAEAAAASTQPSTRPFAEVKSEIADKVLEKPVEELEKKISDAIASRLHQDYLASNPTNGSTSQPTTAATESAASKALSTKEYLDTVALDIQKQFGILPTVDQVGDWKSSTGLTTLHGIGESHVVDSSHFADFPDYALASAAPGSPDAPKAAAPSLAINEPSLALKDSPGNLYFFRVIARQPAHAPPLDEVIDQVKADYFVARGYDLARDEANALMKSAQKGGLVAAATASAHAVKTTQPVSARQGIPGLDVQFQSQQEIAQKIIDLLGTATPTEPHPLIVIALPADKKVLVVQLADVEAGIPPTFAAYFEIVRRRMSLADITREVLAPYFAFQAVSDRIDYRPETDGKKPGA